MIESVINCDSCFVLSIVINYGMGMAGMLKLQLNEYILTIIEIIESFNFVIIMIEIKFYFLNNWLYTF